jgi:hypothetical protein
MNLVSTLIFTVTSLISIAASRPAGGCRGPRSVHVRHVARPRDPVPGYPAGASLPPAAEKILGRFVSAHANAVTTTLR